MIAQIEKHPILSLFVCTILLLGFSLYFLPVSIMEARNFVSAREMLTDNNWLLTTFNGEPRYQKPPLPTWITACFGYLFGYQTVWALRFPAALMVFVSCLGTYFISKDIFQNKNSAFIVALVTLTSLYIVAIIFEAPWDIYAHGFMILAIYGFFKILTIKTFLVKYYLLFAICLTASILSKGPVSIYVLFLPFLISYGIVFGYKLKFKFIVKLIILIAIGFIAGSSWYIYVRYEDAQSFSKIAIEETTRWKNYETKPFLYYWNFFTQSGLWTILALTGLIFPYMKRRVENIKSYKLVLCWTLIAIVFLSLIPTKKTRYVMPVLLPLSLVIGFYMNFQIKNFKNLKSNYHRLPIYVTFSIIASVGLAIPFALYFVAEDYDLKLWILFLVGFAIIYYLSSLIFKFLKHKKLKLSFYAVVALYTSFGILLVPFSKPLIKENFETIQELNNPEFELYYLGYATPEQIFYNGDKIPNILKNIENITKGKKEVFVFTQNSDLNTIEKIKAHFEVSLYKIYDFNSDEINASGYNTRLHQKLYKLSPK
ncbi:ArnT family glycosyltransferase [Winogradskyella litorisediminis]|uniref:ArnT family glycosyltransferase n=1 Tax=Winogradskyella litorisediminis TaxID=1156618 RepID=A0ABW3N8X0_9FLAO